MNILDEVKKIIGYLLGKKSEIGDLEAKDALLAKVVMDIHLNRTHSSPAIVPLFSLQPIHAIDRDNAIKAANERITILQEVRADLRRQRELTKEILAEYLPSVSGIKVVKKSDNSYIAYEGNGRLLALHQVFSPADTIHIEVEEYHFKNPAKILRRMERVRRLNGFED